MIDGALDNLQYSQQELICLAQNIPLAEVHLRPERAGELDLANINPIQYPRKSGILR